MSKKSYAIILVDACLAMILGLVFLFDALDIAFNGAGERWYLVVLLFLSANFIGIAIIKNAPIYYLISSIFLGVFLSLSMPLEFKKVWALIPITIAIGMIVTYLVSKRRLKYFKIGMITLVLSIILLIGGLTESWKYVVPAEIIAAGFITIIYVCVKLVKNNNKFSSSEEEDYHIRPTKEINKKEDM